MTTPDPLSATRLTFWSSDMRFWEVWNLPAVSARTRSASRAAADSTASKTTDAGSAPSAPRTMWADERSAHMAS